MLVSSINTSQPNFNGKVSSYFVEEMNQITKSEASRVLNQANLVSKEVDVAKLSSIKERADGILKRFQDFMGTLHPDTEIYPDFFNKFLLVNKKSNSMLTINASRAWLSMDKEIDTKPLYNRPNIAINYYRKDGDYTYPELTLDNMEKLITGLEEYDSSKIDDAMWEVYKDRVLTTAENPSFFSRIRTFF